MYRKSVMVLLVLVLTIGTLFSPIPVKQAHAEDYINFISPPLGGTTKDFPYEHNANKIDIDATINNVDGASLSYKVDQIVNKDKMTVGQSATGKNILVNGSKIKVIGLNLFSGLNRITFTGNSGGATVTQEVFVNYIDMQAVYNLRVSSSRGELAIKDRGQTLITPEYVSNTSQGTITVKGNAPNVKQVTINIINIATGEKRGVTTNVSSSDGSFTASGLRLNPGKNRMQIILNSDAQYLETYRDLVYYDGNVTFFDEEIYFANNSTSLRKDEPFYVNTADIPNTKIRGKVIVPNNYQSDVNTLRVNAVYMKATNEKDGGKAGVDAGEQIVIEFDRDVEINSRNLDARELNELLGFYYVTGGTNVVEIPALDTLDDVNAQTKGEWTDDRTLVITIGAADVNKFANWLSSNDDASINSKPFIQFKKDIQGDNDEIGPRAGLNIVKGANGAGMQPAVTVNRGDVLLVGGVPVIYGSNTSLSTTGTYDQIFVIGEPGETLAEDAAIDILDPAGAGFAVNPTTPNITTQSQTVTAQTTTDNSTTYKLTLSGALANGLDTLQKGDLVRFVTAAGTNPVYAIVAANYTAGSTDLFVHAPATTTFNGLYLQEITGTASTALNGRTVGRQVINDTVGNDHTVKSHLSLNVGNTNKAVLFTPGQVGAGDLLKVGTDYVVVGVPFNPDGTTPNNLGNNNQTTISTIPVIGIKGRTVAAGDQVFTVTFGSPSDTTANVSGNQRVGMDGKIQLKVDKAIDLNQNDVLDIGGLLAIVTEDVDDGTTLPLVSAPGAQITANADVYKVTEQATAPLGYAKNTLTFEMAGNLPFYVAGSFDSTKPSIIKTIVEADTNGTYKVESGEAIRVVFQNPANTTPNQLKPTSATMSGYNTDIVAEGTSNRSNLGALGLYNSISWQGNETLVVTFVNNGEPFYSDYGYLSFKGSYPNNNNNGSVYIANVPVSGTNAATKYSMVLIGNSFDGDPRSPNPDVNHLNGTTLNKDGTAPVNPSNPNDMSYQLGTVPGYEAEILFMDRNFDALGSPISLPLKTIPGESYNETNRYFVFQFEVNLPNYADDIGVKYYVKLSADNLTLNPVEKQSTENGELMYTLDNPDKPYLYAINYLASPKYNAPLDDASKLTKNDLGTFVSLTDNTTIYNSPFAVEFIVEDPNADDLNAAATPTFLGRTNTGTTDMDTDGEFDVEITATNISGEEVELTSTANESLYLVLDSTNAFKGAHLDTTKDIDNDKQNEKIKRIVLLIKELPFKGTQTLTFTFKYKDSTSATPKEQSISRTVTFSSGPFVQFDAIYDGQVISRDTSEKESDQIKKVVEEGLGLLRGEIRNIKEEDYIYSGSNQKIYLFINNNEVELEADPSKSTRFRIKNETAMLATILGYLKSGENTITFEYRSNGPKTKEEDIYRKEVRIRLVATNLPVIPVSNTDIFPYPTDWDDDKMPRKDNKRFVGGKGTYTTKEKEFNVYGTFDFIDLGKTNGAVESRLTDIGNDRANYILLITRNDGTEWKWDLRKEFTATDRNGSDARVINRNATISPRGLSVFYNRDDQTFYFTLEDQEMPKDGSKVAYSIKVYSAGTSGPYAAYTLEISSTSTPYTIIRPTPQELAGSINRNYLEVVIEAKGADSVVINGVEAEMIDFDDDNDGEEDYQDVFRAIVGDFKPNKKNTVEFVITKGNTTTEGEFEIMYAEDFIPGAEYMTPMKNKMKIFGGNLELEFPKNTYLRRMDPKDPEEYKTQVFSDHTLLFGIANPIDGVVNRYDYIDKPSEFEDEIIDEGRDLLEGTFNSHFVKVSPMYWIDAGMADDPDTDEYDSVKYGFLPHQLPNSELPNFYERDDERMVVPTQRGQITLTYDKNIVADASTWLTVFRFDPDEDEWTNIGGVVDAKNNQITANFDRFGYYVVGKLAQSFNDLISHPYARNHAEAIFVKGVMKSVEEDEFGPDQFITRAEFATAIVRALQIPLNFDPDNLHFDDVPLFTNGLWDYRYIETAANMGILRGTTARTFDWDKYITRQDAAVILARALNLKQETDPKKIEKDLQKLFQDYTSIDPYSRAAVLAIAKKKYVNGSPVDVNDPSKGFVFEPTENLLRGDTAIILANVMKDLKKLPPIQAVK